MDQSLNIFGVEVAFKTDEMREALFLSNSPLLRKLMKALQDQSQIQLRNTKLSLEDIRVFQGRIELLQDMILTLEQMANLFREEQSNA